MNRRAFIGTIGLATTAAVVASPAIVAAGIVAKPKRDPLPTLATGDVLSASYFADLVNRVNELDAR